MEVENKSRQTAIIAPQKEFEIAIRIADWKRLYRLVNRIPSRSPFYQNLAFAMLGVFVTDCFAALPFCISAEKLPAWVLPACIAIGVSSAIMGLVFCKMSRDKDVDMAA
jgi:hypothetical protein